VNGNQIPYHLVDIKNPGETYSVFQFQNDFFSAYSDILNRKSTPILCGGTGLYVESVVQKYKLPDVPQNEQLRHELKSKDLKELGEILSSLKPLHNKTDLDTCQRAIRAIEIEVYQKRESDR
jgi:tRNA dimethylallyltransferase